MINRTLAVYNQQAGIYLDQWGRQRRRVPSLLRNLTRGLSKRTRILDLGCGPGQDVRYLRANGYQVIGLDGTWPFLVWGREEFGNHLLVQGDLKRLPFQEHSFGAIWAAASLIHLTKSEMRRCLRRLLSISVPGGRIGATMAHGVKSGVNPKGWLPGRYISRWTKEELRHALIQAGWKIERVVTVSNQERKGRWLNLIARNH